jgi:hypothetical protein
MSVAAMRATGLSDMEEEAPLPPLEIQAKRKLAFFDLFLVPN